MRNFEQRKAEVFRRSKERISARRRRRNCILACCIPLCLILAVWSAGLFPLNLAPATNGGSDYPGDLVGSAGSNVATNGGQTNSNSPSHNSGDNDGLTGEVPLLTLETYDEYLDFIGSAELPAEFVTYEEISHLGEFKSFVCLSEARVNDFSSCMYTLFDESQSQFVLYVDIGSQEAIPLESTVTDINGSNMRSLVNSTDSGSFIVSGMEYKYLGGKLHTISWFKDNVRYTLFDSLGDYPENTTTTAVAKLLNLETAASALDTLLYEPGYAPISTEEVTDMKKTRIYLTLICFLLICAIGINLTGCSTKVQAKDLMEGITPNAVTPLNDLSPQNAAVTDFAVRLFQASEKSGENTLISPLSVLCALSMTANGAENETLQQMETVLGMTTQELNLYLYSYMQSLPQGEKYKLNLANSIWFTEDERFTVNPDFLQTNADYYGASIYKTPFNDQTCKDINNWVKQNTDKMIPKILDRVSEDAVMYLVNALAFEAEWMEVYEKNQVKDGKFTKEDGTKQNVVFMHGSESTYLEDENATGFMKMYKGGKYAFVAMLPNEGVSISDYVASLDGAALNTMLSNPQYTTVYTSMPKFETEYDVEMSDILKEMGMPIAFEPTKADFAGIGTSTEGGVYISRVLHKTFISVGEKGTKAGAATVVEANCGSAMPREPKEVYLDRPFVYMLIDCENNIPFFIGTLMNAQ